jgi:hypothetical protein
MTLLTDRRQEQQKQANASVCTHVCSLFAFDPNARTGVPRLPRPGTVSLVHHEPGQSTGSSSRDVHRFWLCVCTCSLTVRPPPPSVKATGPIGSAACVGMLIHRSGLGKGTASGSMLAMHALPWAGLGCVCGQVLHLKVLTASFLDSKSSGCLHCKVHCAYRLKRHQCEGCQVGFMYATQCASLGTAQRLATYCCRTFGQ